MNQEDLNRHLSDKLTRLIKEKKDTYDVRRQIQIIRLDHHKELPYEVKVEIISAHNCCDECAVWNNKQISIEEAYERMPIPNKNCRGKYGCRCLYILIGQRNDDGSLKLRK